MNLIHHRHVASTSSRLPASLALAPVPKPLHLARRQAVDQKSIPKHSSSYLPCWHSAACGLHGRRRRPMSTAHIATTHHERMAYVYVRQSTLWQVNEHQESTERQYRLQERALELGWPPTAIAVIDEDQGRSGSSATARTGFRRLVSEVSLGQVGMVLMLEASRLARNSSDWHQLIELCGLSHTLLADESAVYDPRDPNDRLLLGLKGTLSEAELMTIRCRMHDGRWSKARRGVARLRQEKLKIPAQVWGGPGHGEMHWKVPTFGAVMRLLHNPTYAGA